MSDSGNLLLGTLIERLNGLPRYEPTDYCVSGAPMERTIFGAFVSYSQVQKLRVELEAAIATLPQQAELRSDLIGIDALLMNALVVADGELALRLIGARQLLANALKALPPAPGKGNST